MFPLPAAQPVSAAAAAAAAFTTRPFDSLFALQSVSSPRVFGDERDGLIGWFSQLQAACGTGCALLSGGGWLPFSTENPLCRFRAIGYSEPSDGPLLTEQSAQSGAWQPGQPQEAEQSGDAVALVLERRAAECESPLAKTQIADIVSRVIGARPEQLCVTVRSVGALTETRCEVLLDLNELLPAQQQPFAQPALTATANVRRVPPRSAVALLCQSVFRRQLEAAFGCTVVVSEKSALREQQRRLYLEHPPNGTLLTILDIRIYFHLWLFAET